MEKERSYVRRFSAGGTISVMVFDPVPNYSTGSETTTPSTSVTYDTTHSSQRFGGGATAQLALTERFAVTGSLVLRKIGYKVDTTLTTTETTKSHEDTRASLFDIPLMLRFYSKGRHRGGARAFVELGGTFRDAHSSRTTLGYRATWLPISKNVPRTP